MIGSVIKVIQFQNKEKKLVYLRIQNIFMYVSLK